MVDRAHTSGADVTSRSGLRTLTGALLSLGVDFASSSKALSLAYKQGDTPEEL